MSNAPRESQKSVKEKAAAARAAAEAEQRRRDNRVRLIGGIAIVAVIALIIGIAVLARPKDNSSTGTVADAAVPTGVARTGDYAWGVPYNNVAGKPTLAIWEDVQCPACAAIEKQAGSSITGLADAGKVNVVWRPTAFIEKNFPNSPNPRSSTRGTAAWGCAVDAGKTKEYHSLLFANQPANEGDGWTEQQLLDFGTQAGIIGAAYTTFESCVKANTYDQWVANSYNLFVDSAIPGTPAAYLNGVEVPTATLIDAAKLEKLIDDAAAKK